MAGGDPKAEGRECGTCQACCTYLPVSAIGKPALTPCPNLGECDGGNCTIYDTRPEACSGYSCMWLYGYGAEEDRPDRCGVLIDNLLPIANAIQAKPIRAGAGSSDAGNAAIYRMSRQRNQPALVAEFPETRMVRVVGRGAK